MEFDCEVPGCRKSFKRKGDLTRHALLHSGVKPHMCRVCKKGFAQASALKTHLNVHSGAKPYKCLVSGCSARFGDPSSRTRHTKETHEVQTKYRCPMPHCSAAIKRGSSFKSHLKKLHKLRPENFSIEDYSEPAGSRSSTRSYRSPSLTPSSPLHTVLSPYPIPIQPPSLQLLRMSTPECPLESFQDHYSDNGERLLGSSDIYPSPLLESSDRLHSSSPGAISPLTMSPCQTPPLYTTSEYMYSTPHVLSPSATSASSYIEETGQSEFVNPGYAAAMEMATGQCQEFTPVLQSCLYQGPTPALDQPSYTGVHEITPIMLSTPANRRVIDIIPSPTFESPIQSYYASVDPNSPSFWPDTPGGSSDFERVFDSEGCLLFAEGEETSLFPIQRHHNTYLPGNGGGMMAVM